MSFFSGIVDECDRVHLGGYPAPLRELLGLRVEEFWPLDSISLEFADGTTDSGSVWSEWIETEGAEVVASFASGDLAGRPAITRHAFGDGVAWYVGTRPDLGSLFARVTAEAGVTPVLATPPGVQAVVRHGEESAYLILLNHGTEPVTVDLPHAAPDLLTDPSRPLREVRLAPRGVAVLKG